eukprot:Hpha_TRINITY_DN24131_c0_g1::TRINITY_DN24131_c0_g1_i1::g.9860::m.9860/K01069/E3.1.2.6, gloB; hydroxyacylglutathione hydrolase
MRRLRILSRHLVAAAAGAAGAGGCRAAAARSAVGWTDGMGEGAAARAFGGDVEMALVPCLSDNYCPVLHDRRPGGATVVVDTPDPGPILAELRRRQWQPTHILNTHHHGDHVGGNLEIAREFPGIAIVGPKEQRVHYPGPYPKAGWHTESIPGKTQTVGEGDAVRVGNFEVRVLEVGGHTQGHVAYHIPQLKVLFAGDALFTLGCGRVFTGNFGLMLESMRKLRALPPDTLVYCAHEYTESNARFAVQVEPANSSLLDRVRAIGELRAAGKPTVPSLLAHELETNPFLRFDDAGIVRDSGLKGDEAVFTYIRRWKDAGKPPQT